MTEAARDLLADVSDEYARLDSIKARFEAWKAHFPTEYKEAYLPATNADLFVTERLSGPRYIALSMPQLFSPFVRLDLLDWQPLAGPTIDQLPSFRTLMDYGLPKVRLLVTPRTHADVVRLTHSQGSRPDRSEGRGSAAAAEADREARHPEMRTRVHAPVEPVLLAPDAAGDPPLPAVHRGTRPGAQGMRTPPPPIVIHSFILRGAVTYNSSAAIVQRGDSGTE